MSLQISIWWKCSSIKLSLNIFTFYQIFGHQPNRIIQEEKNLSRDSEVVKSLGSNKKDFVIKTFFFKTLFPGNERILPKLLITKLGM